ncbi:hypothetical protein VULLAG_LOCUS22592 [Vulpes lagopus]
MPVGPVLGRPARGPDPQAPGCHRRGEAARGGRGWAHSRERTSNGGAGAKPPCSRPQSPCLCSGAPGLRLPRVAVVKGHEGLERRGQGTRGPLPGPREGDGEREQGQGGRPRLTRPSRPGPWQEQVSMPGSRSWGLPVAPPGRARLRLAPPSVSPLGHLLEQRR